MKGWESGRIYNATNNKCLGKMESPAYVKTEVKEKILGSTIKYQWAMDAFLGKT